MAALPLAQAAQALGVSVRQLRRDLRAGAPQARRGRRGRGGAALVDPAAIAAWRALQGGVAQPDARLRIVAAELPEILADAIYAAFLEVTGAHKRETAGALAGAWYLASVAALDRLRRDAPGLPDVSAVPEKIARLRHIFEAERSVERLFPSPPSKP